MSASFSDQDQIPSWAENSIQTLVDRSVLSGNDDGSFAPNREMNRVEFCKLIVNATGVTKYLPLDSHFPDIERGDWFFDFVETAKKYGWVSGYPDGYFRPAGKINRAEVAKILAIAFGLDVPPLREGQTWSDPYFQALAEASLLAYGTSFDDLGASVKPSRSEIAEQIYRFMKYTGKISPYDTVEANTDGNQNSVAEVEQEVDTSDSSEVNEETTAPVYDNPTYEYTEQRTGRLAVNTEAGDLYIEKASTLEKKIQVSRAQKNVVAHRLLIRAQEGPVRVGALTFRRMGAGDIGHFQKGWISVDGMTQSERLTLSEDVFTLSLDTPLLIQPGDEKEFVLMVDIGYRTSNGSSSRFVLYRPDWIDSDTDAKIGFFPLGGTDIVIR